MAAHGSYSLRVKTSSQAEHGENKQGQLSDTIQEVSNENKRIDELVREIKQMFRLMSDGETSASAYDTAWMAMVPSIDDGRKPQFPVTLEWILTNQNDDGSWGEPSFFLLYDRLICTLACVVALKTWATGDDHITRGIQFLLTYITHLGKESNSLRTVGFEVIFPSMLNEARNLGIDLPYDIPYLKEIFELREKKISRIPLEVLHSIPTTLLHSLEALQEVVEWEKVLKLQSRDGSLLSSAAATAVVYMKTGDKKCLEFLNYTVRRFGDHAACQYPIDIYERIWTVDTIERLGVDHLFREEISRTLDYVYRHVGERGLSWGRDNPVPDIDDTCMALRLLRLHGYPVSSDILASFKDRDGNFVCFPGQSHKGVSDMFNLYRCSQVSFPGEKILKEAKDFVEPYLRNCIETNQVDDKWTLKKALNKEIDHALRYPWKMSLQRLEAREYMDFYGDDDLWIGKTVYWMYNINNPKYLELAKLEYNRLQNIHRRDNVYIMKWWTDCGFRDLLFNGINPQEIHFSIAATMYEPPSMRSAAGQVMAEIEADKPSGDGIVVGGLSPLSETLWKEKTNTEFIGDVSARLTWKDLTVAVTLGSGEMHTLLEGLTGYAEPGSLTALMGPSGSGKSTLLDSLAGRLATNAFMSGSVLLNGRKTKLSFGTAAYVTQDDNLIGTLTVRETIIYSARLRLPDKMPREEKEALVDGTIIEMGLQDCADTVIGNWHLRGISGGEKRRVSIALEILMRPRLLFLDEPTSGLDSASAFFVTQTLRSLSRDGRTVITSIHQPSSEVFELFDQLYLLSGGKTIYFGRATEAFEFFAHAGLPCPSLRNPSDHFLRCVNSDFDKVKATLKGSIKTRYERTDDPLEKITTAEAIRRLIEFYKSSQYNYAAREKVDEISRVRGTVLDSGGSQASFLMQTYVLTKRSFINMSRDFGYYWLRLVIYLIVTVCIGTIYLNVGTGYTSILARGACASFVFGFVTFMSIGGFPSFVEDMKVFQRERLNGHYGVTAFVISNTLSGMPFLILITFLSGTICYFMVHLHPGFTHYMFFVLALYASVTVVESLMMAIASVVPNFLMGIVIGAGIQGIFMLVSGFFRLPNDIPKIFWRYPMSYISFHFWALQGQYQNDLQGLVFDGQTPFLPKITGDYVLKEVFQIDVNRSKWIDLSVLFCMIIIYRIIFFIMIKFSEDVTPWFRGYIARRRLKGKSNRSMKGSISLTNRSPSLRDYVADPASSSSSSNYV